jgi:hypothetical protein
MPFPQSKRSRFTPYKGAGKITVLYNPMRVSTRTPQYKRTLAVYSLVGGDDNVGQPRYCHVHHGSIQCNRTIAPLKQLDLRNVERIQRFDPYARET